MKYAPSALVGRLSRSSGATTAGHNRFGAYLRNRVIPTNPQSSSQTSVRSAFATNSQAWRNLTDAQRAAWTSLGLEMVRTDTLGQAYSLQGNQAYQSVSRNIQVYGGTPSATPPLYNPPAGITSATVTGTAS